jgi:hypothetical protein
MKSADKKKTLQWHVPTTRATIYELQAYLITSPDLDPRQLFYYAKQEDIRKLFGQRVELHDWPDEFGAVMGPGDGFWATIKGVGRVFFVGEKPLREAGFTVPPQPFCRNSDRNHPGRPRPIPPTAAVTSTPK